MLQFIHTFIAFLTHARGILIIAEGMVLCIKNLLDILPPRNHAPPPRRVISFPSKTAFLKEIPPRRDLAASAYNPMGFRAAEAERSKTRRACRRVLRIYVTTAYSRASRRILRIDVTTERSRACRRILRIDVMAAARRIRRLPCAKGAGCRRQTEGLLMLIQTCYAPGRPYSSFIVRSRNRAGGTARTSASSERAFPYPAAAFARARAEAGEAEAARSREPARSAGRRADRSSKRAKAGRALLRRPRPLRGRVHRVRPLRA